MLDAQSVSPEEIISTFKESPFLSRLFTLDAGVWEGYSVERHTQMVMAQFEHYFGEEENFGVLSKSEMRLLLALHDIGKAKANLQEGTTVTQHKYTKNIMLTMLPAMGLTPERVGAIVSLMEQDILGEYLFHSKDLYIAVRNIHLLARQLKADPGDVLRTLEIFQMVDGSAYTTDAGGAKSFDASYEFSPDRDWIKYARGPNEKLDRLRAVIG
jgi:hypothetical protein